MESLMVTRMGLWAGVCAILLCGCRNELDKGEICLRQGDWVRAVAFYEQAVDHDPADGEARSGLARALLQKAQSLALDQRDSAHHWDAAAKEMEIAIQEVPDSLLSQALYETRLQAARKWANAGDTTVALHRLAELREAYPRRTEARNAEAILSVQRGDWAKATDLFLENVAIDSNNVTAQFNLGLLLWKQGRTPQAASFFLHAARIAPRDPEIQYWLEKVTEEMP
jgi:Flp pilus assembly protein TadD